MRCVLIVHARVTIVAPVMTTRPFLGFGLGLRTDHFQHVLEHQPVVDWFEVTTENFTIAGGKPKYYLHAIREHYPMTMHGVSLSIGSSEPLDMDYLRRLKLLAREIEPEWISDHLCWTRMGGINSHDLLPLPYTDEAIRLVAERVQQVQDYLGRQILLENVSSYLSYTDSGEMTEWEFYNAVCEKADCLQLFDINNVYVSARNHGFDPKAYIAATDPKRVWQFHLAGHTDYGDYVIDTHDQPVCDAVWSLYRYALEHFGPVSTMIERDDNIPDFDTLWSELQQAKTMFNEYSGQSAEAAQIND
jgi:uncharacterized protein